MFDAGEGLSRLSIMMKLTIFLVLMIYSSIAFSEEGHRHHEAHQHGSGELGVVVEGTDFSIVLRAPASDLVGFEHVAQLKDEIEAVRHLERVLEHSEKLFVFPSQAKCSQVGHRLEHALSKKAQPRKADHGKEGREHHHSHSPSHDQGEDQGSASHSEISTEYRISCKNSKEVNSIQIGLFREFPSLKRIEASIVTPSYQSKQQLNSSSSTLTLTK